MDHRALARTLAGRRKTHSTIVIRLKSGSGWRGMRVIDRPRKTMARPTTCAAEGKVWRPFDRPPKAMAYRTSKNPPAKPEAFRLLAPQRGLIAIDPKTSAPEADLYPETFCTRQQ